MSASAPRDLAQINGIWVEIRMAQCNMAFSSFGRRSFASRMEMLWKMQRAAI
jgi:hypothetical protein